MENSVRRRSWNQWIWITLFSVAMGFLEAAVVIYLRALYYPNGFLFPLQIMDPTVAQIEIFREVATVIMLLGIGYVAGRNKMQRFSFFLSAFAIWDLFYYVFLKLFLDWPSSFTTWDILFLVPVPWIGPVYAPCIVSGTMLALAAALYARNERQVISLNSKEWILLIIGSGFILESWIWDFLHYASQSPESFADAVSSFVPVHYNWFPFVVGEVVLFMAIFSFWRRTKSDRTSPISDTNL